MPVVILSHRRAGRVSTFDAIRPALLCIPDDQYAEYKEAHPDVELLVHPAEVRGLAPKRQWIYEELGDCFQIDDDISSLRRLYDPDQRSTVEADEAYELVQATASVARQLGVKLWGMANNSIGRNYAAAHPFRTTGYVNGMSLGLLADPSGKLHFPDDPHCVAEDYYVSALNAYHYRYIWADDRFGFHQQATFHSAGGQAEFRNMYHEERWMNELKRLFGSNTIVEKHMARKHQYEKILHVPWSKGVA